MRSKVRKALVLQVVLALGAGAATAALIDVDCDAGGSLQAAVMGAAPGDVVQVTGTCNEAVTVSVDRLVLDGSGATLDGDGEGTLLTVANADDVVVRGFTLRNGRRGLVVRDGATVTVDGAVAQDNLEEGFRVEQALLQLIGSVARDNGEEGIESMGSQLILTDVVSRSNKIGLRAINGGSVRFVGSSLFRQNQGPGIVVQVGASALAFDAEVVALDNGSNGLELNDGSGEFVGGTLKSRDNGVHGIALTAGSSLQLGFPTASIDGEVLINGNGQDGIFVAGHSTLDVDGNAHLATRGNTASGIHVRSGGVATVSGVEIRNNGLYGINADDASITVHASDVRSNGPTDVLLGFGTRATISGNRLGSTFCDGTVLARGENDQPGVPVCP